MNKPQPKQEIAIVSVLQSVQHIIFYGTPDAVSDISEFGYIHSHVPKDKYTLIVDTRYDFGEVVDYMKNYSAKENKDDA